MKLECAGTESSDRERIAVFERLQKKSGYPLFATLELTHRCDLKCPHCYVSPVKSSKDLSLAEIVDVLDQLASMGVIAVNLTGGEPTVRVDFFDILEAAASRRFVTVLKTNAAALSEADVVRMRQEGLFELNVSIYHHEPEKHDAFVGKSGAWEAATRALRAFAARGGNVRVGTLLMDWNLSAGAELERWYQREGWKYNFDIRVEARNDGEMAPTRFRARTEDLVDAVGKLELIRNAVRGSAAPRKREQSLCGIGDAGIVIQPNGNLIPCVAAAALPLGNVRENKIARIWTESNLRKRLQSLSWGDSPKCLECVLSSDCYRCPAAAYVQHGDLQKPTEWDCEMAKVWQRARLKVEQDGR